MKYDTTDIPEKLGLTGAMTKGNSDIIASMTPKALDMVVNAENLTQNGKILAPKGVVESFQQNGIGHLIDENNFIHPSEDLTQLAEMIAMHRNSKRRREVDAYMATVTETLTHNHGTKVGSQVQDILREMYYSESKLDPRAQEALRDLGGDNTISNLYMGSKQEQIALRYFNTQAVPRNKISFSHKIKIFWLVALLTVAFLDLLLRKYT